MLPRQTKDLTTGKRVALVAGWSIGLALLLGITGFLAGSTWEDPITRAARSAATGIAIGALIGAANAG